MTKEEFNSIIDRYLDGEATPSEKRLVENFFSSQKKNHPVDDSISSEMWKAIEATVHKPAWPIRVARKIKLIHVLAPLSIVVILCTGVYFYQYAVPKTTSEWMTEKAPYGQKTIITLTDGSKVFLNSGSTISFPKNFSKNRQITLSGEAFFEVVRNPARPFTVRSSNVTTKVLGTSFNVQAFIGRNVSVTVATGKVQVEAVINDKDSGKRVRKIALTPRQQAVLKGEEWTTSEVDLTNALAWKTNTIRFDETTMDDVAMELERWYNVSVKFEDERIRNCRINGQFKDQSLEHVLKSIQYMYKVDFKYTAQNQIILYGNGCKN